MFYVESLLLTGNLSTRSDLLFVKFCFTIKTPTASWHKDFNNWFRLFPTYFKIKKKEIFAYFSDRKLSKRFISFLYVFVFE